MTIDRGSFWWIERWQEEGTRSNNTSFLATAEKKIYCVVLLVYSNTHTTHAGVGINLAWTPSLSAVEYIQRAGSPQEVRR